MGSSPKIVVGQVTVTNCYCKTRFVAKKGRHQNTGFRCSPIAFDALCWKWVMAFYFGLSVIPPPPVHLHRTTRLKWKQHSSTKACQNRKLYQEIQAMSPNFFNSCRGQQCLSYYCQRVQSTCVNALSTTSFVTSREQQLPSSFRILTIYWEGLLGFKRNIIQPCKAPDVGVI